MRELMSFKKTNGASFRSVSGTSVASSRNFRKPTVPLLRLAKQKRFADIMKILQDDNPYIDDWIHDYGAPKDDPLQMFKGETILHLLLTYQPPAPVVDLIVLRLTEPQAALVPEDATDLGGRTPLHVAAANGCSAAVIERLLNGENKSTPAKVKDSRGRYALHWACSNPTGIEPGRAVRRNQRVQMEAVMNMTLVVKALMQANPLAALCQDENGMTPLDLAKHYRADEAICAVIKELTPIIKKESPRTTAKSLSDTEASSSLDLPMDILEISETDEISSIGSCGVSVLAMKAMKARRLQRPSFAVPRINQY